MNNSTEGLFERWFYCDDLGVQLVPVIKEFFASEQCRTGRPIPGTIPENPPYVPDCNREVENPFDLKEWLELHRGDIQKEGKMKLFDDAHYQSEVVIYGKGIDEFPASSHETWLWQLVISICKTFLHFRANFIRFICKQEGESTITLNGIDVILKTDDSLLVPAGKSFKLTRQTDNCFLMSVAMPTPNNKEEKLI